MHSLRGVHMSRIARFLAGEECVWIRSGICVCMYVGSPCFSWLAWRRIIKFRAVEEEGKRRWVMMGVLCINIKYGISYRVGICNEGLVPW